MSLRFTTFGLAALALRAVIASAQQRYPDKRTTASGDVVTIYSIAAPPAGNAGGMVSADVEVCASEHASEDGHAFPSYFQLHFADKGVIGEGLALPGKPPLEITPLKPKQCVRGWMNFAVTPGQVPVSIHYRELSADKKPIDWMIK